MGINKLEYSSLSTFDSNHFSYRFSWFHLVRPLTFSGTISPILAGTGLAALKGPIRYDLFLVLLVAALLVQMSANLFNDYYDFKHGQDKEKWINEKENKKPSHKMIPFVAFGMIGTAVILGAWISVETNWWIALVGTISILSGIAYSAGTHSFSALGLGELIAAIFLGFVTTILGYIVQGHSFDIMILAIAFIFALLISTMILTNNIRDIKKDIGFRHTVAMRLGKKHAVQLLTTLLVMIYAWNIILIIYQIVPITSLIAYLALPIAMKLRWSFRNKATRTNEINAMKWAGRHHWVFGLLFALGIWLGL